jgi:hypothetical protein
VAVVVEEEKLLRRGLLGWIDGCETTAKVIIILLFKKC